MTAPLISFKNICYSQAAPDQTTGFKQTIEAVAILKDMTLDISAGQTVSIVGPSGSGKTSLMMLIAGLEAPTSGQLCVAGHHPGEMDEDALAAFRRDHIGIVFQDFHLIPTLNARENVAVPLDFAGHRDSMARAEQCLHDVGLAHRMTHLPAQLSGGEKQRVALARAFATEPAVLLADEPTGNLDSATGARITDLLFALQAQYKTTLILITHDPALARRCQRSLTLCDGRITGDSDRGA